MLKNVVLFSWQCYVSQPPELGEYAERLTNYWK